MCLVFENLKVARGRKRVKLWVEIKHLRFIFVCLVTLIRRRRRWRHTAQRSSCDQFFIAGLATVWHFFFSPPIQLGLNKEQGTRSHDGRRFVFIMSVILDCDLIPSSLNRPPALTLKHMHEFSPLPHLLSFFCTAE